MVACGGRPGGVVGAGGVCGGWAWGGAVAGVCGCWFRVVAGAGPGAVAGGGGWGRGLVSRWCPGGGVGAAGIVVPGGGTAGASFLCRAVSVWGPLSGGGDRAWGSAAAGGAGWLVVKAFPVCAVVLCGLVRLGLALPGVSRSGCPAVPGGAWRVLGWCGVCRAGAAGPGVVFGSPATLDRRAPPPAVSTPPGRATRASAPPGPAARERIPRSPASGPAGRLGHRLPGLHPGDPARVPAVRRGQGLAVVGGGHASAIGREGAAPGGKADTADRRPHRAEYRAGRSVVACSGLSWVAAGGCAGGVSCVASGSVRSLGVPGCRGVRGGVGGGGVSGGGLAGCGGGTRGVGWGAVPGVLLVLWAVPCPCGGRCRCRCGGLFRSFLRGFCSGVWGSGGGVAVLGSGGGGRWGCRGVRLERVGGPRIKQRARYVMGGGEGCCAGVGSVCVGEFRVVGRGVFRPGGRGGGGGEMDIPARRGPGWLKPCTSGCSAR